MKIERRPKSTVFRSRRNVISDGAFLTDDGKVFHARAEATGKARSPSVVRLVEGTTSVAESAVVGCTRFLNPLTVPAPITSLLNRLVPVIRPANTPLRSYNYSTPQARVKTSRKVTIVRPWTCLQVQ